MPYIQGYMLLGDKYDKQIVVLERFLGDSATIQDGHLGEEPSRARELQERVQRNLFGRLPQPSSPLERPLQPSSSCLRPNNHLRVV